MTDSEDGKSPRRAILAIIKYCDGCHTHSALSTVAMLAQEALEEYDNETEEFAKTVEALYATTNAKSEGQTATFSGGENG